MDNSFKNKIIHQSPFSRQIYTDNDIHKILKPGTNHGLCGSQNLGNTCFMNSSIACISNCYELTYYFLSKTFVKDINRSNYDGVGGKLAEAWYNLINYYWNTRNCVGNPSNIKSIVGYKYRKFSGYSQQDSNEFMTVFLDILGEDLNRVKKKVYRELQEQQKGESDIDAAKRFWNLHTERNDNIITDLFHGLLKSTITCPRCKFNNITYDPFNTLALNIPDQNVINFFNKNAKNKMQKKVVKIEKKKEREKEIIDIFYISPHSFRIVIRYHIEIYKQSTLNEIIKEINQRSIRPNFNANSQFISVINKQFINFIDKDKPFNSTNSFTFAYAPDYNVNNQACIPVYISYDNDTSAFPRLLFVNYNDSYYELKKKIYILVRQYFTSPFSGPNRNQEKNEDKILTNYIEEKTNDLFNVLYSLENEFHMLQTFYYTIWDYNINIPYQIYLGKDFKDINKNYLISEGMVDFFNILKDINIRSNNDKIDKLIYYLSNNQLYLNIKLNKNSRFMKNPIKLNNCIFENCKGIKNIQYETYYEEEIIEEEMEPQSYYSSSNNITLDHCLQYFTEIESLDEENEWYCNKCKKRVMASKQIELFYLPRILCICLTRFIKHGGYYSKNNKLVEFPIENLNMKKYMCGPDKDYSQYDLFAVSQHYGDMGGGHYTAVCKNIDGKWYSYDDSSCYPTSKNNIITQAAYVLFYRRKGW